MAPPIEVIHSPDAVNAQGANDGQLFPLVTGVTPSAVLMRLCQMHDKPSTGAPSKLKKNTNPVFSITNISYMKFPPVFAWAENLFIILSSKINYTQILYNQIMVRSEWSGEGGAWRSAGNSEEVKNFMRKNGVGKYMTPYIEW